MKENSKKSGLSPWRGCLADPKLPEVSVEGQVHIELDAESRCGCQPRRFFPSLRSSGGQGEKNGDLHL